MVCCLCRQSVIDVLTNCARSILNIHSSQQYFGRIRCAVDQQFDDEFHRYPIERPNKSVALIVMNICTTLGCLPTLRRFAARTSTPETLHRHGIVSAVEFDRDVCSAALLVASYCMLCGVWSPAEADRMLGCVFDKKASK